MWWRRRTLAGGVFARKIGAGSQLKSEEARGSGKDRPAGCLRQLPVQYLQQLSFRHGHPNPNPPLVALDTPSGGRWPVRSRNLVSPSEAGAQSPLRRSMKPARRAFAPCRLCGRNSTWKNESSGWSSRFTIAVELGNITSRFESARDQSGTHTANL
jgi:hypothetical protein